MYVHNRVLKTAVLALTGAAVLIALCACSSAPSKTDSAVPASAPSSTVEPKAQNSDVLEVGSSAHYGDVTVTVMDISEGPKTVSGAPTIRAIVSYANNGQTPYAFNESDWTAQDAKGVASQDKATISGSPKTLGSGELVPKDSVLGDIYLASASPIAKVIYTPSSPAGDVGPSGWAVP